MNQPQQQQNQQQRNQQGERRQEYRDRPVYFWMLDNTETSPDYHLIDEHVQSKWGERLAQDKPRAQHVHELPVHKLTERHVVIPVILTAEIPQRRHEDTLVGQGHRVQGAIRMQAKECRHIDVGNCWDPTADEGDGAVDRSKLMAELARVVVPATVKQQNDKTRGWTLRWA